MVIGYQVLLAGAGVLVVGIATEILWYVLFSTRYPHIQRRSVRVIQFLRVVMIAWLLYWVWHDLKPLEPPTTNWIFQCMTLSIMYAFNSVSLSSRWHVSGQSLQERAPQVSEYYYQLPYACRWYLRRTTIANPVVFIAAAFCSAIANSDKLIVSAAFVPIMASAAIMWVFLSLIRRIFYLYEPPIWDGAVLHDPGPPPKSSQPGMPDIFDVEEYLHRMPPERSE